MSPLTVKQQELLDYLRLCTTCPTIEEMRIALALKSKSGVHRLVEALEERGFIRRLKNRARAIEIIENPELPSKLSEVPDIFLAREAKRRGLVLGHVQGKHFMELRA